MTSKKQLTAKSWDSYKETLLEVLDIVKPVNCFEWGAGLSTQILALYPTVKTVDSVEHSETWYEKFTSENSLKDVINYYLRTEPNAYLGETGRFEEYDLIFVDGKLRSRCLNIAKWRLKSDGVLMLHDAERDWYTDAIEGWPHRIFTDDGSTLTMTYSKDLHDTLSSRLEHVSA